MIFQSELFCFLREADNPLSFRHKLGQSIGWRPTPGVGAGVGNPEMFVCMF